MADGAARLLVSVESSEAPPRSAPTDHGVTHSIYIVDPDGNELELYIDVPGVDWDDPAMFAVARPLHLS